MELFSLTRCHEIIKNISKLLLAWKYRFFKEAAALDFTQLKLVLVVIIGSSGSFVVFGFPDKLSILGYERCPFASIQGLLYLGLYCRPGLN